MRDGSTTTSSHLAKVFVLDSDPSVTETARGFAEARGIEIAHADTIDGFLAVYEPDRPACLLLAIRPPSTRGLTSLAVLRNQCPSVAVVVLAEEANVALAVRSLKSGVIDFLEKPIEELALIEALSTATATARKQYRTQRELEAFEKRFAELTERQREVFLHVVAGRPSKVIAYDLGISERTVEVHRGDLFRRMGVASAVELAWLSGTFHSALAAHAGGLALALPAMAP